MQVAGTNSNALICIIQALQTIILCNQTSVHWEIVKTKWNWSSNPYQGINKPDVKQTK